MWSFRVSVNDMKVLIDPLITLGLVDIMADGIFSPDMFCIMADSDVSIHSAFGIELLPPFFDTFYADEVRQLFWFRLTHLFPLAVQLLESGYTSFTFSIERFRYNHAQFKFEGPNGLLRKVNFLLTHVVRPLSIRKIDLSAFVTMDSREFSSIISKYHMFGCVSRWISFSYAIIQETIIILQDGQCITGCIRAPNEVQFIIAVVLPYFSKIIPKYHMFDDEGRTIPRDPYYCRCPRELCKASGHCGCVLRGIPCNERCRDCGRRCRNPWGHVHN